MLLAVPAPPPPSPRALPRPSRVARGLELLRDLERLAPQVTRWILAPATSRGPRPLCDARALAILDELRALFPLRRAGP